MVRFASLVTSSLVASRRSTAFPFFKAFTDTSLASAAPSMDTISLPEATDHAYTVPSESLLGVTLPTYFSVAPTSILSNPVMLALEMYSTILSPYTSHSLIPIPVVPLTFFPTSRRSALVVIGASKFKIFQTPSAPFAPPCKRPTSPISTHSSPSRYCALALDGHATPPPSDHHITRMEDIVCAPSQVRVTGIGYRLSEAPQQFQLVLAAAPAKVPSLILSVEIP